MVGFCTWRLGLVAWFWDYLDTERKEAIWMGAQMNVNVLNSRKTKPQALKDLIVVRNETPGFEGLVQGLKSPKMKPHGKDSTVLQQNFDAFKN